MLYSASLETERLGSSIEHNIQEALLALLTRYPTPWIREANTGNSYDNRSRALWGQSGQAAQANTATVGPADLCNWRKFFGERSSKYINNEFPTTDSSSDIKDPDGYVGYYHFCNGIDYSMGRKAVDSYMANSIGLVERDGRLHVAQKGGMANLPCHSDKPMVFTISTWNSFSKAEFTARYTVGVCKSRKIPVPVSYSYSIKYDGLGRAATFNLQTVDEIPQLFWDELAALSVVRAVRNTDDPATQLCGTVNLADQVSGPDSLKATVDRLVFSLPRGHLLGQREFYGVPTGLDTVGVQQRTSKYRNNLVDTLVRVVLMDPSGEAAQCAIDSITSLYDLQYVYVVCQLLKTQTGRNNNGHFLEILNDFLKDDSLLCQAALLLLEQVKYLISNQNYALATPLAARAVTILPLDFDCWYYLSLCYIMEGKMSAALDTMNSFPIVFNSPGTQCTVDGVFDSYASRFMDRMRKKPLDLRTFENFFPIDSYLVDLKLVAATGTSSGSSFLSKSSTPTRSSTPSLRSATPLNGSKGKITNLWSTIFQYHAHSRHPIVGPFFLSPLSLSSAIEASSVEKEVQDVTSVNAAKMAFASRSSGSFVASLVDFDRKSTWGRTFDLLTTMIAIVGWDELVRIKTETFSQEEDIDCKNYVVDHTKRPKRSVCLWLQQLFLVIYQDLRMMKNVTSSDIRSALSWEMIGLVGWSCKSNLQDTIAALATSSEAVSNEMRFDYFGTVKLLEIYNELILSDVTSSSIGVLSSVFDGHLFSNKLLMKNLSLDVYERFIGLLIEGHFSMEKMLVHVMALASWNLRWYGYMPNYLVLETLGKMCSKFDQDVVRATTRMVFSKLKKSSIEPVGTFSLKEMFAPPKTETKVFLFVNDDSIVEYLELIIEWRESFSR